MTPQYLISQLLESETQYPGNLDLLKKIIITSHLGRLLINGLPPDNKVALGNYLFDQERTMFDFTRLSDEKRALFMQWFLEPHQKDKTKAFLGGVVLNEYRGFTAEAALTWWGRIKNWMEKKYLEHWKISDLNLSLNYQLTGIEMCYGKHGVLIGFNQFLVPGSGTKYKDPNDSQQEPLGNTKRVFITDKLVDLLTELNIRNLNFESICKSSHPQSIEVGNLQERLDKMYDYRKMQKFLLLKPWYIRMWAWIFPWIKEDHQDKNKSVRAKHLILLHKTETVEIFQFFNSDEILVREKRPNVENIVFCGGGSKIFAHVGVWKGLNEKNICPDKFAGSSAGAIMALLCYLGYSAQEIEELFKYFKQEHLIHFDITLNGLSEAGALKTALDFAIANKLNQIASKYNIPYPKGKITFAILEAVRQKCPDCGFGKELVVTATNKKKGKTRYFSLVRSPHFEVSEAVKTSSSVPIVYRSTLIDGEEHNDGGVLNNFPTEAFFDDHSTLLESEYGNNLRVLAVKFDDGSERKAVDHIMDKVYKENVFLNWIYKLLTGVSDPASGWEQDRMKLRKYASQSIVINLEKISSPSFSVSEESRQKMIDAGYRETKNYLDVRYNKNKEGDYQNEELMYETFHSLGDLLAYCCYRGDSLWFEQVKNLIMQSSALNKWELIERAQELKNLYFSAEYPASTTPYPWTFFGNTVSHPIDPSIGTENYKILLAVYPVWIHLSPELLKNTTDKKIFDGARHSFALERPFICLDYFAKIGHETHVILHIVIHLLTELKNNPREEIYQGLEQVLNVLKNKAALFSEEYFARWDLSFPQCMRVLRLFNDSSNIPMSNLLHSLRRRNEPLQRIVAGVYYEDSSASSTLNFGVSA